MTETLQPTPPTDPVTTPDGEPSLASSDAERALVEVSRLLVSKNGADLQQVLACLANAFHADHAYFTLVSADIQGPVADGDVAVARVPSSLLGTVVQWSRDGAAPSDIAAEQAHATAAAMSDGSRAPCLLDGETGHQTVAIPLLAEDDEFVGYLGFETPVGRPLLSDAHQRLLSVLGDILGAHLSRLAAEESRELTHERWQRLVDRHPDSIVVMADGILTYANAAAAHLFGAPDATSLLGMGFRDVLSAADEESVAERQSEQLASESPRPTEHTVIRLDGDERVVESVSVPFPGVDGAIQTVLRDVTERKESEVRYRTFVETISEGVWRVDLARSVRRDVGPEAMAEHVLAHGHLAELNPAMSRMFWGESTPLGEPIRDLMRGAGHALFHALAVSGYRLHNYEMIVRPPSGAPRHVSVNAVGQFDRDQLTSVWGSCTDITDRVAMERSMVDALEEQQERIGRDLHDSVGQLLTGIRMLSESFAARLTDPDAALAAHRVASYASEALDRVRAICRGLVPPHLYSEGVASALAELVDHVDSLSATRCTYRHAAGVDLREPEVGIQFYRIAQEAISNALRHAQASNVWTFFGEDDGDLVMEIEDDGVGFDLGAARDRSLGLSSMRRRAHIAGAMLAIETRPGSGTTVRVSIARPTARPHLAIGDADDLV